jgi:hypothetical protein
MKKKLKKSLKKRLRQLVKTHGAEEAMALVTGFLAGLAGENGHSTESEPAPAPAPRPPVYPPPPATYPPPEPNF